eukprot:6490324-Amphidinium_carterae.1
MAEQLKEAARSADRRISPRLRVDLKAGRPRALAWAKEESRQRAARHRQQLKTELATRNMERRKEQAMKDEEHRVKTTVAAGSDGPLPGVEEDPRNEYESQYVQQAPRREQDEEEELEMPRARSWDKPQWLLNRINQQKERQRQRRKQRQRSTSTRSTTQVKTGSLMALGMNTQIAREEVEFIVDSGASATVISPAIGEQVPIRPCTHNRTYKTASKDLLRPLGTRVLDVLLPGGMHKKMVCEVLHVHRSLASVSRICDNGFRVVFDKESYIEEKTSGQKIPLERRDGVFILKCTLLRQTGKSSLHLAEASVAESAAVLQDSSASAVESTAVPAGGLGSASAVGSTAVLRDGFSETSVAGSAAVLHSSASEGDSPAVPGGFRMVPSPPGLYPFAHEAGSASSTGPVLGVGSAEVEAEVVRMDPPLGTQELEGEEGLEEDEESGEKVISKAATIPARPTEQMVKDHEVSHIPYRSWCSACVQGRARRLPHKSHEETHSEETAAVVSIDYTFLGDESVESAHSHPVLVVKDRLSKAVWSHPLRSKDDPHGVASLVKDLRNLGYRRLTLKCDREPAMTALAKAAQEQTTTCEITVEHPPKGVDHRMSNGEVERANQTITGLTRTLLADLEGRVGHKLDIKGPVVAWMIEYAGSLHNMFNLS